MESGKQGASSETSSDGSDQQVNLNRTPTKRSYECTYCKRGFTNAQALGGHMNIHRKDRAKAKQSVHINPVTNNNFNYHKNNNNNNNIDHEFIMSNNNFMVPNFSPLSSHHMTSWYGQPIDHDHDHRSVYFQPSSGPSIPSTFPFGYPNYETTPNHTSLAISNEELLGADLSLQIDCDDHEGVSRGLVSDEVLDLELRLGYR